MGLDPNGMIHEERLSRVFDEVMGLGDFADSSRGSASSSRSGGQGEGVKGEDETLGQEEQQPVEEEDSNCSGQEEKMDEGTGEPSFPRVPTPSSERRSSFTLGNNEGGGGGGAGRSGGAAFDDAVDGLEDDEDWHFALPMGSLEDVPMGKANRTQPGVGNNATQDDPFANQPREDEEEEQDREGSSGSANTSHSSQDRSPDNSQAEGVPSQTEETEDSQPGERSEAAPLEDSNPQMSPPINIKDEPIDEGYDAALLPQSSIRQIKEELEHQEEELRISSVYSVGGGTNFASPTNKMSEASAASALKLHSYQPFSSYPLKCQQRSQLQLRQPFLSQVEVLSYKPYPSSQSDHQLQSQLHYHLRHQHHGHLSPLFLVVFAAVAALREILQPRDMITIPSDDNAYWHFCGAFCLSVFRHKKDKKGTDKMPDKWAEKRPGRKPEKPLEKPAERPPEKPFCSVCKVANRIEHEVTHQGRLHRLCSDACFVTWRKMRQLAMNCCEGCGLYCNSSSGSCQTLTIERSQLNFCGPTCIGTYKQTCRKMVECAYCHKMAIVSSTIMERDQKGKVQLYCSSACVEQSRPPRHILTGTAFPCCLCKVSAVPQYHLAMVDGTIRNFCSYDCVTVYRKSGHTSQPDLINGTSSLRDLSYRDAPKPGPTAGASSVPPIPQDYPSSVPYQGHHPSHTSVPPLVPPYPAMSSPTVLGQTQTRAPAGQALKLENGLSDNSKLSCHQCSKQFSFKPLLFSHQGRISMFCSKTCCEQYKTLKNILVMCECCKQEKVLFDTVSYNQQDLFFCSESCKLLFKHDLTSSNKDHPWRPCTYCSGIGQKMLHSHYGGRMEEFCRPHCMSQYTVLFYGMGRCDSCRKQSYMSEKLQCLGSVRNFCNLPCLLQYCYLHFETSQHVSSNGPGMAPQTPYAPTQPHHSSKMNPVIADVVSLANGSASQPSVSADTALTGALPTSNVDGKNLDHASTQTDAMRVPVSRRRQMKNKSVLCRPFTMDQGNLCQLSGPSTGSAVPSPSPTPQGETQPCDGVPARLTGRHFLGKRETDSDCKVCSQHKRKRVEEEEQEEKKRRRMMEEDEKPERETEEEAKGVNSRDERTEEERCEKDCEHKSEALRRQTSYYCKTCSGEPSLCPVPCFELYHTRLIYKTPPPELETQALSVPSVSSSAGEEKVKVLMVPVPVPVFIPVPMNMYSQHTPVPMAMPLPVPVPMVVPPEKKEMKDAAVQSEPLAVSEDEQKDEPVSTTDESSPGRGDMKSDVVTPIIREDEKTQKAVQVDLPLLASSERSTESTDAQPDTQAEGSTATSDPPPTTSAEDQPPSSPMMDLETDFPPESLDQKSSPPQRGVKRPREGFSGRKRGRRRTALLDRSAVVTQTASKLNHLYGVKAWRTWVQQRNKQPREPNPVDIKEDVLQCDSAELSFALSRFIKEARRPNGETYSPDSIFYLCLGIQQYLFTKGRIENIFTDEMYSQFATEITGMLQLWKPKLLPSGGVVSSRVVESYLWECKQLGAYSPIVLLNTLLFFCTKNFRFTTLAQHQSLSFSNFTRCSKPCSRTDKVHYLRYERRSAAAPRREETERLRKRHAEAEEEGDLEMPANITNPLHCPVRLYEFYLSRCPESVKKKTDMFYLQPEQNVHTYSSHWFTTDPLEGATLQSMLTRILAVREVHQEREAARQSSATADDDSLQ
ncbi:Zinc finger MYM-type protein 4 [Collichthys lucidus]|uniref:Zinc finger MYM-type protein 4 n=1 Tax=Collichthys lucidus TaxID=240159 RepID=A0A4U5VF32_COLLU|nr:Zinc finger MYM-type protein 4 [Collichthys lucidus]